MRLPLSPATSQRSGHLPNSLWESCLPAAFPPKLLMPSHLMEDMMYQARLTHTARSNKRDITLVMQRRNHLLGFFLTVAEILGAFITIYYKRIVQCCHIIAFILLFSLHLQPLRFLRNANYAIKNEIAKCFLIF